MTDLTTLPNHLDVKHCRCRAIIETPKGGRNKYKYDPERAVFTLGAVLPIGKVFPYDYVIECTEESLRNLKLETIDLQQLHVWNSEWTAGDEWRRAFEDLKKSGKAQAVGVSVNAGQPDSALDLHSDGEMT